MTFSFVSSAKIRRRSVMTRVYAFCLRPMKPVTSVSPPMMVTICSPDAVAGWAGATAGAGSATGAGAGEATGVGAGATGCSIRVPHFEQNASPDTSSVPQAEQKRGVASLMVASLSGRGRRLRV